MARITLAALLVSAAVAFSWSIVGHIATAQSVDTASLNVEFTIPVEDGSTLRVTVPSGDTCVEIPVAADRTAYATDVAASERCRVSKGDSLTFWLIHPNGGLELLAAIDGTDARWEAGATLTVRLGHVPCPEPCRPPQPSGPMDPLPTDLPASGEATGGSTSRIPLIALALVLPGIFVLGEWWRRRSTARVR